MQQQPECEDEKEKQVTASEDSCAKNRTEKINKLEKQCNKKLLKGTAIQLKLLQINNSFNITA